MAWWWMGASSLAQAACPRQRAPPPPAALHGRLGEQNAAPPPPAPQVTVPRPAFATAPLRVSRPQQLQSSFLPPVAELKGMATSFARECAGG